MWKHAVHFFQKYCLNRRPRLIAGSRFSVWPCPEGIKLFSGRTELTERVGLTLVFVRDSATVDVSAWTDTVTEWGPSRILGIRAFGPDKLGYSVECSQEDVLDICFDFKQVQGHVRMAKIILMLSSRFKQWWTLTEEGSFPRNKTWCDVPLSTVHPEVLGVFLDDGGYHHALMLNVPEGKGSFENASKDMPARLMTSTVERHNDSPSEWKGQIRLLTAVAYERLMVEHRKVS